MEIDEDQQGSVVTINDGINRYSVVVDQSPSSSELVKTPPETTSSISELPKKSDEEDEETNSKKRPLDESASEDDGTLCPICLDNWSNAGEHRICSLKCGHLFGLKCLERWFNTQTKRLCPTCKAKVGRNDIRYIYARKLIAVDRTEIEDLKKELEQVKSERNRVQIDLTRCLTREYTLNEEISRLKIQLEHNRNLNQNAGHMVVNNVGPLRAGTPTNRLYMDRRIDVCKHDEGRVFDVNCRRDLVVATIKSPNLFGAFGLKNIQLSNYRQISFIPIHQAQIRDICFHPSNDNLILTASMDKSCKITDYGSNTVTEHFNYDWPLWACAWDINDQNILFAGSQSGDVVKYDIRNSRTPLSVLSVEGDTSPVVAIAPTPSGSGEILSNGGVLSCKLKSLWLFENSPDLNRYLMHLEGPLVSMKYNVEKKQLLVSARPSNLIRNSRHYVCTLEKVGANIYCNPIHIFQGGGMQKLLSKSCFLSHGNLEYVAAHQEDVQCVNLWSVNTGEKICSLPAKDSVLDLKGVQNHNGDFLISLTKSRLEFFKFV